MRTLLLIDLNNQLYRAAATRRELTSGRRFTGGLYGFLVSAAAIIKKFQVCNVAICTDSKPYLRSYGAEEYKGDREKSVLKPLVEESKPYLAEFFEMCGWPVWALPGYESDDLMAWAAHHYRHRFDRIVGMCNDSDLYQSVLSSGGKFILSKQLDNTMDLPRLRKEMGDDITSGNLVRLLAMVGTHNNVPGIAGVGLVTARKTIASPAQMRTFMYHYGEQVLRNERLIKLPWPDFPADPGLRLFAPTWPHRKALMWAGRYDITWTLAMVEAFEEMAGRN